MADDDDYDMGEDLEAELEKGLQQNLPEEPSATPPRKATKKRTRSPASRARGRPAKRAKGKEEVSDEEEDEKDEGASEDEMDEDGEAEGKPHGGDGGGTLFELYEMQETPEEKAERNRRIKAQRQSFTPEQKARFDASRKARFESKNIKKIIQYAVETSKPVPKKLSIIVGGVAKVLVAELIEESRKVMLERGETGPTRPIHLEEAYRRVKARGGVPMTKNERRHHRLFRQ